MDTAFFDSKAEQWDAHRTRVLRAEEIYKKIIAEIGVSPRNKVLDFGCGTGLLGFHFIDSAAEVTFADISAGMLEQVRKKAATLRRGCIKTIDLTEHTITEMYDTIISLLALHHVEDVEKTVCHLAFRVAEGGYLCLSDLDLEDGSFHYPDAAPHNGIDRNVVMEVVRKSGMYVICNKTVYTAQKIIDGAVKTYPIFLIIGKRDTNRI